MYKIHPPNINGKSYSIRNAFPLYAALCISRRPKGFSSLPPLHNFCLQCELKCSFSIPILAKINRQRAQKIAFFEKEMLQCFCVGGWRSAANRDRYCGIAAQFCMKLSTRNEFFAIFIAQFKFGKPSFARANDTKEASEKSDQFSNR
jgi:hypothetical protein